MAAKVGKLIKEARIAADLTQEKLAKQAGNGLTANDISLAERGEKDLTQAQLKAIAKATGVTQASLLNAARDEGKKTTAKKTAAKKTAEKMTAEKKPKTPASAGITRRVTATEKKLIEAYRLADSQTKKAGMKVLKGECSDMVTSMLGGSTQAADSMADMLGDVLEGLFSK